MKRSFRLHCGNRRIQHLCTWTTRWKLGYLSISCSDVDHSHLNSSHCGSSTLLDYSENNPFRSGVIWKFNKGLVSEGAFFFQMLKIFQPHLSSRHRKRTLHLPLLSFRCHYMSFLLRVLCFHVDSKINLCSGSSRIWKESDRTSEVQWLTLKESTSANIQVVYRWSYQRPVTLLHLFLYFLFFSSVVLQQTGSATGTWHRWLTSWLKPPPETRCGAACFLQHELSVSSRLALLYLVVLQSCSRWCSCFSYTKGGTLGPKYTSF